jgi:peroxidase
MKKKGDESPYDCCSAMTKDANVTSQHHPECLPISIPSDDSIYSHVPCMNFIRSTYGKDLDGSATPAGMRSQVNLVQLYTIMWEVARNIFVTDTQINSVTHWIDASNVYGSSIEKANELRDTTSGKGRMKTSVSSGHQMLPLGNTSFLSYQAGMLRNLQTYDL